MAKVHNLTIDDLYKELAIARKNGLGKKKIMLSDDDECNGVHLMFFSYAPANECIAFATDLPYGVNMKDIDDYVVLG